MTTNLRYVGLDVHAETIAVAVAEADGEVRALGEIPNRPESVARLMRKLGRASGCGSAMRPGPAATSSIGSSPGWVCSATSWRPR